MHSLFRYPGGKTWLVPRLRGWLRSRGRPSGLIGPFAGGGIVGLTAVFADLVDRVTMVELDEQVAADWEFVLNGYGVELAKRIVDFDLTEETVRDTLGIPTVQLCIKPSGRFSRTGSTAVASSRPILTS